MRVQCDAADFARATGLAAAVVGKRSVHDWLAGLLVKAEGPRLLVRGTDLITTVTVYVDSVDVEEPGELLVRADRLAKVASELGSGEGVVTVRSLRNKCEVTSEQTRYSMATADVCDFAPAPAGECAPCFTLPAAEVGAMLRMAGHATAKTPGRYAMTGVLVDATSERLRLVGTDGKCMAALERTGVASALAFGVLPQKAVDVLTKTIRNDDGHVSVSMSKTHAVVEVPFRVRVEARLLEGSYPPYELALDAETARKAVAATTVAKADLLVALRRASLLAAAGPKAETAGCKLTFGDPDGIALRCVAEEGDDARTTCPVIAHKGASKLEVAFDPAIMAGAVKAIPEEHVTLRLSGELHPCLMQGGDAATGTGRYTYLLAAMAI